MADTYHIPVLASQCLELLDIVPAGTYVDVTYGGGGHSHLILENLNAEGRLIGFDQDPDARANALQDARFTLVPTNFAELATALGKLGIDQVDGILADLGVSSHQIDTPGRGFSYRQDGPLDMRMDTSDGPSAAELVNTATEEEIADVLYRYGDIRASRKMATAIVGARQQHDLNSTKALVAALQPVLPKHNEYKLLSMVFQALRIAVNREMSALEDFLVQSPGMLKTGGRLVVISYHSLEDRRVKNFMRTGKLTGGLDKDFYGNPITPWTRVTRKAMKANAEEQAANPRSRSAVLRAVARNDQEWTTQNGDAV